MSDFTTHHDDFVESARAYLHYWQRKVVGVTDQQRLDSQGRFGQVCRAIRIALQNDGLVQDAAQLAIGSAQFSELSGQWAEWSLILRAAQQRTTGHLPVENRILNQHLGRFLWLDHRYEESISAHRNALESAEIHNDHYTYLRAAMGLASCYLDKADYQNADIYLSKILAQRQAEIDDMRLSAQIANGLGRLHLSHKNELLVAKRYFEKALREYTEIDDSLNQMRVLLNLGVTHYTLREFDIASDLLQKASQAINQRIRYSKVLIKLVLGAIYFAQERWEAAADEFSTIDVEYLERNGYVRDHAATLNNLGNALLKQKEYENARTILRRSEKLWEDWGDLCEYANTHGTIGESYKDEGQWKIALPYFQKAVRLLEQESENAKAINWLRKYRQLETDAIKNLGEKS